MYTLFDRLHAVVLKPIMITSYAALFSYTVWLIVFLFTAMGPLHCFIIVFTSFFSVSMMIRRRC